MDLTMGIVRVLKSNGALAGTGFVVSERGLIATCAHVVGGRQKHGGPGPARVAVVFHSTGEQREAVIEPDWWRPPNAEDVTILLVEGGLPTGVQPLPLGPSAGTADHNVQVFGFPKIDVVKGAWGRGRVLGPVADGERALLQLRSDEITAGFSGAPVWSKLSCCVIGMVTSITLPDRFGRLSNVAFATPSETLQGVCPGLMLGHVFNNPFIPLVGRVDRPEDFFDREQEIERIFEFLNRGASVALVGERAIGKSSLLRAVYRQAGNRLDRPRQPIYLDLGSIQDDDDFYDDFCTQAGISTCRGAALRRALKKPRLLLILDEMEMMSWDGFTHPLRVQLRALANGHDAPLRLVLAASTPLDRLFPDSENQPSPFYNICIEITLKPWSENTARDFIVTRLAPTPVRFAEEEIGRLVQGSKGHPKELVGLCYRAYEDHIKQGL